MKLVITAVVAILLTLTSASARAQPFVMKISSPVVGDATNEWMRVVKERIELRSKGKIRVELYPSNQLGQLPATIEGVTMGTIEMTITSVGFLTGLEPRFQVFDTPGLFDSIEHGESVVQDPAIRRMTSSFGESKGIEPLFISVGSPLMLLSHRAICSLSDFNGQKIRAPGASALHVEPLRKFGASPISMTLGEVMPALQNHTIDGMIAGFAPYVSAKYYDISKNLTEMPGSFMVAVGLVNRKFLNSLGSELEQIVREESRNAEVFLSSWGADNQVRLRKVWRENGGRIHVFSAADRARYVAEAGAALKPILASSMPSKKDYAALLNSAARHRNMKP